ncbi:MAG: class I SAM-dependent rRNA methyltransferase [Bacteroidetes bacterium]|nr:class I SAM-dependent rRNA methyltransferase [Bacteroidota bacterium]
MTDFKTILGSGKDASPKRFHPWVFSGAIKKTRQHSDGREVEPQEGDIVTVYSNKDEYLGTGHYSTHASIAIRIITFEEEVIDQNFWNKRIQNAVNYRKQIGVCNAETNIYRLVHAEGDLLPGLIIDMYGNTAVIQAHSVGMYKALENIKIALQLSLGDSLKCIFQKSKETLPKEYAQNIENSYLMKDAEPTHQALEYGNTFNISWEDGQKTGFFIDQRENRALLGKYSKGKNVLNTFCYSGGFSVYALKAGAKLVHSVDASARAMDLTDKNIALNPASGEHKSFTEDTFDFLEKNDCSIYDVVVLDPPAFAKHHSVKHNAVQGYKRLNMTALKQMKSGSILFTFSCSQAIDMPLFYGTILSAAILAGKKVRVMHQLSQPADHPINIFHQESSYLKGLVLEVE